MPSSSPATDTLPAGAFFVTGTDTEVGKTMVCAAMACAAAERGRPWRYYKPAESGGAWDSDYLAAVTQAPDRIHPGYRLSAPLAPRFAAELEGKTIDLAHLDALFRNVSDANPLIVEGAGGLLTPYAPGVSAADLALRWNLPVLIVVGNRLGALNHALLTQEVLEHRGIGIVGCVFNDISDDSSVLRNPHDFAALSSIPILAHLPKLAAGEQPSAHWWYTGRKRAGER